MTWFWLVIFYSFGGYLLEKGYAAARALAAPGAQVLSAAAAVPGVRAGDARGGASARRRVRSHSGGSCSMAA